MVYSVVGCKEDPPPLVDNIVYNDMEPDIFHQAVDSWANGFPVPEISEWSTKFDCDNDGQNDYQLKISCREGTITTPSSGYYFPYYVEIIGLNENTIASEITSSNSSPYAKRYRNLYGKNDRVERNANPNFFSRNVYIDFGGVRTARPVYDSHYDDYLGIRLGSDRYGWIKFKLDVDLRALTIESAAVNQTPGLPIKLGQKE